MFIWLALHYPRPIFLLFVFQRRVPRITSRRERDADRIGGRDGQVEHVPRQQDRRDLLDVRQPWS